MRALLFAILMAGALGACGATPEAPAGAVVKLTLTDFAYSDPAIEIPAGEKVTFELTNAGKVEHDIVIEAIGFKVMVQPGKTALRNIGPLEPGEYEMVCTVLGHKELGMVGKVIVR